MTEITKGVREKLIAKYFEIKREFDFTPLYENLLYADIAYTEVGAKDLVDAFLQFFCLHAVKEDGGMYPNPIGVVDEVYHTFILNDTEAYFAFCKRFFGEEIHHVHRTACDNLTEEHYGEFLERVAYTSHLLQGAYGAILHPLLSEWIEECERLSVLSFAEREQEAKRARIKRLIHMARHYAHEASALMETQWAPRVE